MQRHFGSPMLVVTSGGPDFGRRIVLSGGQVVVGRDAPSDVRLYSSRISRTHAFLRCRNGAVYVQDAGSSSGTFVNRERVMSPRQLRQGDVVRLADVQLRFDGPSDVGEPTNRIPAGTVRGAPRYDINEQRANTINNVGRDQYLIQQRENFLSEIAATKTRARYLIAFGFLLFVVGFAMFASGVLKFISQVPSMDGFDPSGKLPTPFGGDIFGVPAGVLGWSMSAIGTILIIVGIVLHVVATSRRKRVDREFPNPGSTQFHW